MLRPRLLRRRLEPWYHPFHVYSQSSLAHFLVNVSRIHKCQWVSLGSVAGIGSRWYLFKLWILFFFLGTLFPFFSLLLLLLELLLFVKVWSFVFVFELGGTDWNWRHCWKKGGRRKKFAGSSKLGHLPAELNNATTRLCTTFLSTY